MSVVFAQPQLLIPAVVALVVVVLLLSWSYLRASHAPLGVRIGAFALKLVGIAALLLCLLDPLASKQTVKPGANTFVVLVDNSRSMRIGEKNTDRLRDILDESKSTWPGRLEELFTVRRYAFDSRARPVNNFSALEYDGRLSSLHSALRRVADQFKDIPLAGILLFTDGNATDPDAATKQPSDLPPIYPVSTDAGARLTDLSLRNLRATESAYEDTPVTVDAEVRAIGFKGDEIEARMIDGEGKAVASQLLRIQSDDQTLPLGLETKTARPGVGVYRVEVAGPAEKPEATAENNQRLVVVNRKSKPMRILYVAGRPNWEHKFLQRALESDDLLQLTSLIRIARREPKFQWLGRPGESSNPLYRGFEAGDEAQRYDEPVLLRMKTRDESELRAGFPTTAEDLFVFDAVILDDIEAGFFTREQMRLLQRFVTARGGGLLMLGGAESFLRGGYADTPIAELLPVYLNGDIPPPPGGWLHPSLTQEGMLQSWARLRPTESAEKERLAAMSGFAVLNPVHDHKPGAFVVESVTDAQGHDHPAVVVQSVGKGRAAAALVGDIWRWGMEGPNQRGDMETAWRQLVRWLTANVPGRLEIKAEADLGSPAQSRQLRVTARSKTYEPDEKSNLKLAVIDHAGKSADRSLQPDASIPGDNVSRFTAAKAGLHIARATVDGLAPDAGGIAETGWIEEPDAKEFETITPNHTLLKSLADQTGGEVLKPESLDSFVTSLPDRKVPVVETTTYPLWHRPAFFLFALGCLVGEWGLRRWKRLP
jgi:hypothetical protein